MHRIQDLSLNQLQALHDTKFAHCFQSQRRLTDGKGDFFIGAGSNLTSNPSTQRLYPFKGKIQEVALYK